MPSSALFALCLLFATFLLSLFLTAKVKAFLVRRSVLDIPNERSSHSTPVPRGGGWATTLTLAGALLAIFLTDGTSKFPIGLLAGFCLVASISGLDDRRGLSPALRLSLHLLAACLGSTAIPGAACLFGGVLPLWLDRTLLIVGWAWFMNLYNFMDGIDGITAVQTISIAVGICSLVSTGAFADNETFLTALALIGTSLGFLCYNWHPARLFLGDIGSIPLGYIVAFCLISLGVSGHLAAALILPAYYLADSGITITKRALRREKIWQAHRQHFYQKAALGLGRHDTVVGAVIIANVGLIACAMVSVERPWGGIGLALVVVAVLLQKMHKSASLTRAGQ